MKKILFLLALSNTILYANTQNLSLEERVRKIEKELEETKKEDEKIEEKIKLSQEKYEKDRFAFNNEKVEFHGYFRTSADGNMKEGNKKSYDRAKNIVGRWGNEYDTNFNFELSRKFTLENGAWSRVSIKAENWNNIYNNSLGDDYKLNVTNVFLEMGDLPIFTGAFEDAVIVGGKRGWDGVIVDPIDYYYQDIGGTGVGIDKVKFLNGELNLAYISADFDDKTQHTYIPIGSDWSDERYDKGIDTAGSVRAYKGKYTYKDISLEMMYAHAVDHNNVKRTSSTDQWGNKVELTRNVADQGFYAGLYYNPKNFFGLKGWGQHYLQFGSGVLAGNNGLGRINTPGNMLAHKDSKAYQLGLGGLVNINPKTNMLVTFRTAYVDKVDSRDKIVINNGTFKPSFFEKENNLIGFDIRPIYTVNQYVDLCLDAGIGRIKSKSYQDETWEGNYYKISAGPQLRYSIGFAETTIKAYVTYIGQDIKEDHKTYSFSNKKEDLITEFQVVAWW